MLIPRTKEKDRTGSSHRESVARTLTILAEKEERKKDPNYVKSIFDY